MEKEDFMGNFIGAFSNYLYIIVIWCFEVSRTLKLASGVKFQGTISSNDHNR